MSTDRILAIFPVTDDSRPNDAVEIVAAIEAGLPITYERRQFDQVRLSAKFSWSNERVALSVAMANAGWGHLNHHTQRIAESDVEIRRVRIERGIDQGQVTS